MTEAKRSDSVRPVSPDLVQKAVDDLNDGTLRGSLQKIMDDVDTQRRTNPGGMKDYLDAVNDGLKQQKFSLAIVDSGRADQLAVESENHMSGINYRVDGKPLSYYKPVLHELPAAVSDLMKMSQYTNISPPGLGELKPGESVKAAGPLPDFTLHGDTYNNGNGPKFGVLSREETATQNADGTTTYNYKGKLDSSFTGDWGSGGETLLKVGNVGFTASETISPDNKVLSRHVEYDPANQKRTWVGSMGPFSLGVDPSDERTVPALKGPFTIYSEHKGNVYTVHKEIQNDVKTLDTKFNSATSRYETTTQYLDGRVVHYLDDTKGQSVAMSAKDCHDAWGEPDEHALLRDDKGFVIANVKRDANEEVTEFTDAHGLTNKRIDGDRWMGPDGPFRADVFADNQGNIVEKTAEGTTVHKGDLNMWFDKSGRMLREQTDSGLDGHEDTEYKFNADGQTVGVKKVVLKVDSKGLKSQSTYEFDTEPGKASGLDLNLSPDSQHYCHSLDGK